VAARLRPGAPVPRGDHPQRHAAVPDESLTWPGRCNGGQGLGELNAAAGNRGADCGCASIAGMMRDQLARVLAPFVGGPKSQNRQRFLVPSSRGKPKTALLGLNASGSGVRRRRRRTWRGETGPIRAQGTEVLPSPTRSTPRCTRSCSRGPAKKPRHHRFVVPRELPGVSIGKVEDKMGQAGAQRARSDLDRRESSRPRTPAERRA